MQDCRQQDDAFSQNIVRRKFQPVPGNGVGGQQDHGQGEGRDQAGQVACQREEQAPGEPGDRQKFGKDAFASRLWVQQGGSADGRADQKRRAKCDVIREQIPVGRGRVDGRPGQ